MSMEVKEPVSIEQLLLSNIFLKREGEKLTPERLRELWQGLLSFYANGFITENNPLKIYQELYFTMYEPGFGLIIMEKDLLTLLSYKYFESNNILK